GLLYRASGASAYRNDPTRIGYNDNHYLQTVDVNNPNLGTGTAGQAEVFNANPQGDGANGPYGLKRIDPNATSGPRPTWVMPLERRTDTQTGQEFRIQGPNEYHAARDLT